MIALKLFGRVTSLIEKIIDKTVSDKDYAASLKHDMQIALMAHEAELSQMGKDVIMAEATGGWLQRNWRPCLMFLFIAILANNFLIAPYVSAFGGTVVYLDLPPHMWQLMTIGVGGYAVGRSYEKAKVIEAESKGKDK